MCSRQSNPFSPLSVSDLKRVCITSSPGTHQPGCLQPLRTARIQEVACQRQDLRRQCHRGCEVGVGGGCIFRGSDAPSPLQNYTL